MIKFSSIEWGVRLSILVKKVLSGMGLAVDVGANVFNSRMSKRWPLEKSAARLSVEQLASRRSNVSFCQLAKLINIIASWRMWSRSYLRSSSPRTESPISNCGSPPCEGNLAFDSSSSRLEMERKTNAGRKKIEMKLISASDARQVTFSKRRSGLFKKASELATLCDSETAVIAFSPGGKAFSFGHPSVEAVINRYDGQSQALDAGDQSVETDNLRELIQRYNALLDQLEVEKKRGEAIKRMGMEMKAKTWLLTPVENLNPTQLQILKVLMEDLKKRVYQQREELSKKARTPRPLLDLNTGIKLKIPILFCLNCFNDDGE
ncbi:hypothetical protein AAG906_024227 [Vitis piasezkii]